MTENQPRYRVIVWPAMGPWPRSYHVWDNQFHVQVCGRWDTLEAAQAHADQCNEREQR